jgi:hypothetical protein
MALDFGVLSSFCLALQRCHVIELGSCLRDVRVILVFECHIRGVWPLS